MSKAKKPCLFDNSKECPARNAADSRWNLATLADKACPICPIRLKMLKEKASFGEM